MYQAAGSQEVHMGLMAWNEFMDSFWPFEVLHTEVPLLHLGSSYGGVDFGGTVDGVIRLENGLEIVLDIKSGRIVKAGFFQVAAYAYALGIKKACLVKTDKYYGRMSLHTVVVSRAYAAFEAQCRAWYARNTPLYELEI